MRPVRHAVRLRLGARIQSGGKLTQARMAQGSAVVDMSEMRRKEGKMIDRVEILYKFGGRCAYCGKVITLATMQVDHVQSQRNGGTDDMDNLNPACRLCNHYKRGGNLESFREKLKTLHERLMKIYIVNVAVDHGIVKIKPFDGKFYFEKTNVLNTTKTVGHADQGGLRSEE